MPTMPEIKSNLKANSVEIMNQIRATNGKEYQSLVPKADATIDSIRNIGKIIMGYQPLQNQFLYNLINRIGRVWVTSRLYENPWKFFMKGFIEYGESVEEIFVGLAKSYQFDPQTAGMNVDNMEIPEVFAAFHVRNYQQFYKDSVSDAMLSAAFLSWDGVTDLIGRIVESMYTSAAYDEFLMMKYLIARRALDGGIKPVTIPDVTDAESEKGLVKSVKGVINRLGFMSSNYNFAGVPNFTDKRYLVVIISADMQAAIDVDVLSAAFNMGKVEFEARQIMVDSWEEWDTTRLNMLLGQPADNILFTAAELAKLKTIKMAAMDEQFMMIFDNKLEMNTRYVEEGLYWNYWLHTWKTFSVSPFANAILFTTETSSITAITVTPSTAEITPANKLQFTYTATTTGFEMQGVKWTVNEGKWHITDGGLLMVHSDAESGGTITVTATSLANPAIKGTATVTIA